MDTGLATGERRLTLGVPQGSITSPLAWNVFFEPILELANAGPGKAVGYADDYVSTFSGVHRETVLNVAQTKINEVEKLGRSLGITFNPGKTEIMLLGPTSTAGEPPKELKVNGTPVPFRDEVTYLGMKINNKLDWRPHIDNKIKGAKLKLMTMNTAFGKYWGPRPALMLWAYKQVVLPALSYGCVVFAHKIDNDGMKKLRRLSRLAHQLIAPIARSAPTGGLEVITGSPPIHLEMERLSMNAVLSIDSPKPAWEGITNKGSKGFYRHWTDLIPDTLTKAVPNRCRIMFNWTGPC